MVELVVVEVSILFAPAQVVVVVVVEKTLQLHSQ